MGHNARNQQRLKEEFPLFFPSEKIEKIEQLVYVMAAITAGIKPLSLPITAIRTANDLPDGISLRGKAIISDLFDSASVGTNPPFHFFPAPRSTGSARDKNTVSGKHQDGRKEKGKEKRSFLGAHRKILLLKKSGAGWAQ